MDHRRVVTPAELAPDLRQRPRRQPLGQIHGDLARSGDGATTTRGNQIERLQFEMRAHQLLDLVDGNAALRVTQHVAQRGGGELQVDRVAGQLRIGDNAVQRAFQLADIGVNARGEQIQHIRRDRLRRQVAHLALQDRAAQHQVGRLDVGDQPCPQPAQDARLDPVQRLRRAIRRNHQPLARADDLVDRVEKFFLGRVLARDELQIVDQQQVGRAQPLLECKGIAGAHRGDELEHESLGRHAQHRRTRLIRLKGMADRMHQVGLALPGATMKEQGAETRHARLGQRQGGVERDPVRSVDHEPVEGEARVQRRPVGGDRHHRRRCGRDRCRGDRCGCLEQCRCRSRAFRGQGARRRCHRRAGGQHGSGARRHARFHHHCAQARQRRLEFEMQPVRIMAAHPVGHEGGRQRQADRVGLVALDQFHRLQPLVEQPRACRLAQARANARPGPGLVRRRLRGLPIRHARTPPPAGTRKAPGRVNRYRTKAPVGRPTGRPACPHSCS